MNSPDWGQVAGDTIGIDDACSTEVRGLTLSVVGNRRMERPRTDVWQEVPDQHVRNDLFLCVGSFFFAGDQARVVLDSQGEEGERALCIGGLGERNVHGRIGGVGITPLSDDGCQYREGSNDGNQPCDTLSSYGLGNFLGHSTSLSDLMTQASADQCSRNSDATLGALSVTPEVPCSCSLTSRLMLGWLPHIAQVYMISPLTIGSVLVFSGWPQAKLTV